MRPCLKTIFIREKDEYQVEAAKYIDVYGASYFKNEHQIAVVKKLVEQGETIDYSDYQYIAKIYNHCQSDAIEAGKSLDSVFDMNCDHSDF